jgi:N-acyl-D-aspartate/D-glutamate deacylase
MAYDLLITTRRVVDGSGGPSCRADVAVHWGESVGIGRFKASAMHVINWEVARCY